jgi:hypothetical protein
VTATGVGFTGIREEGLYVIAELDPLLATHEPAFVRGVVHREGSPAARALVQSMRSPFPTLTDEAGRYIAYAGVSLSALPTSITFIAEQPGDPQLGGVLTTRVPLEGQRPPPPGLEPPLVIPIDIPPLGIGPGNPPIDRLREFCKACEQEIVQEAAKAASALTRELMALLELAKASVWPDDILFAVDSLNLWTGETRTFVSKPLGFSIGSYETGRVEGQFKACGSPFKFVISKLSIVVAGALQGDASIDPNPGPAELNDFYIVEGSPTWPDFEGRSVVQKAQYHVVVTLTGKSAGQAVLTGRLSGLRLVLAAEVALEMPGITAICPTAEIDLPEVLKPEAELSSWRFTVPVHVRECAEVAGKWDLTMGLQKGSCSAGNLTERFFETCTDRADCDNSSLELEQNKCDLQLHLDFGVIDPADNTVLTYRGKADRDKLELTGPWFDELEPFTKNELRVTGNAIGNLMVWDVEGTYEGKFFGVEVRCQGTGSMLFERPPESAASQEMTGDGKSDGVFQRNSARVKRWPLPARCALQATPMRQAHVQ